MSGVLPDGSAATWRSPVVVLATGGVGYLYASTTAPDVCTGDGLAMAYRAGAALRDLEFVQFHPTALAVDADPRPLITEALRGAGALLVDGSGHRILAGIPGGELAARDVVARAVWRHVGAGEAVYLDATSCVGPRFPDAFPAANAACMAHGIDPRTQPIPVTPAAHYHMGGVLTDEQGRSSLAGLWAVGECASSGLHGGNRLASNSLLEGIVMGRRAAAGVARFIDDHPAAGVGHPDPAGSHPNLGGNHPKPAGSHANLGGNHPDPAGAAAAGGADSPWPAAAHGDIVDVLRATMTALVGVERSADGLSLALERLEGLARAEAEAEVGSEEVANMILTAGLIAAAARSRQESRGAHFRQDHPAADPRGPRHQVCRLRPPEANGAAAATQPAPMQHHPKCQGDFLAGLLGRRDVTFVPATPMTAHDVRRP